MPFGKGPNGGSECNQRNAGIHSEQLCGGTAGEDHIGAGDGCSPATQVQAASVHQSFFNGTGIFGVYGAAPADATGTLVAALCEELKKMASKIEDVELEKSLRASSARIRKHMNDDHADSCKAYAAAHGAGGLLPDEIDSAVMIGLDSRGFTLRVSASKLSSPLEVLIPYPRKLEKAAEVRKLAVEMHMTAYNTLGVGYKIRHNFYGNAAKQAWTHMPAKVKYPMAVVLVGVLAASVKLSVVGVKMLRRWR